MPNFYELINLMEADRWGGPDSDLENSAARNAQLGQAIDQAGGMGGGQSSGSIWDKVPAKVNTTPDPSERLGKATPGTRSSRQPVSKRIAGINPSVPKAQKMDVKVAEKVAGVNNMLSNAWGDQTNWRTQGWTVAKALHDITGDEAFKDLWKEPYNIEYTRTGGAPYKIVKGPPVLGAKQSAEDINIVQIEDPKLISKVIDKSWQYIKDPREAPADWETGQRLRRGGAVFGDTDNQNHRAVLTRMGEALRGKVQAGDKEAMRQYKAIETALQIDKRLGKFVNRNGWDFTELATKIGFELNLDLNDSYKGLKILMDEAPHMFQEDEDGKIHIRTHFGDMGDMEHELSKNRGGRGATTTAPTGGNPKATYGAAPIKQNDFQKQLGTYRKLEKQLLMRLRRAVAKSQPDNAIDSMMDAFADAQGNLLGMVPASRRAHITDSDEMKEIEALADEYDQLAGADQAAMEWVNIYEAMCYSGV